MTKHIALLVALSSFAGCELTEESADQTAQADFKWKRSFKVGSMYIAVLNETVAVYCYNDDASTIANQLTFPCMGYLESTIVTEHIGTICERVIETARAEASIGRDKTGMVLLTDINNLRFRDTNVEVRKPCLPIVKK